MVGAPCALPRVLPLACGCLSAQQLASPSGEFPSDQAALACARCSVAQASFHTFTEHLDVRGCSGTKVSGPES